MRPPQEPSQVPAAFMRTSNDELPIRGLINDDLVAPNMRPEAIPHRESVPSASDIPSSSRASPSHLSPPINGGPRPTDDLWRVFAQKLQETHERERRLWEEERALLYATIEEKEDRLRRLHARMSLVANAMLSPDGTYDSNASASQTLSPKPTSREISRMSSDERKSSNDGIEDPARSSPPTNTGFLFALNNRTPGHDATPNGCMFSSARQYLTCPRN